MLYISFLNIKEHTLLEEKGNIKLITYVLALLISLKMSTCNCQMKILLVLLL